MNEKENSKDRNFVQFISAISQERKKVMNLRMNGSYM